MKFTKIIVVLFVYCLNVFSAEEFKNIVIKDELEFKNIKLHEALSILSKETSFPIISSENIKDRILNYYFPKNEHLETILNSICMANNLLITKEKSVVILSDKNSSQESQLIGQVKIANKNIGLEAVKISILDSSFPSIYTAYNGYFIINNFKAQAHIIKFEKEGFITKGQIVNGANRINFINIEMLPNDKYTKKDAYNTELSLNNSVYINDKNLYPTEFSLKNISTKEAVTSLKEIFSENIKISEIEKSSKIIVLAERDIINSISKIISSLDRNLKQVKITTQILDISNNLFEELGFDWMYDNNSDSKDSLSFSILGNMANSVFGNIFSSNLSLGRQFNSKKDVLTLGINLLHANHDLVVSSVPSILITNGEEGEFKITEEVIVGEKKFKEGKDTSISEPIFKEAGIIMKVRPLIKENDDIVLHISLEVSDFKFKNDISKANKNSASYNAQGGSKVGRSINTVIKLKDGETVLIGGLKKAIKHQIINKVPILGDIPLINIFFKSSSTKKEFTDMYIKLQVNVSS